MKKRNKFIKALSGVVMACMFLLPITVTDINAAEYEIVFKAGAHGTVDGKKEVSHRLSTNDVFPDEPAIAVEDGYVFKGWSKQLPSVGSKVSGKAVYVAKYGVVIDGVTYTVRYVDENRTDIATPKTMTGENGTSITERAKNVPGYTYQQAEQTFTLSDGMEVQFVYTLTNPNEVIRYETVTEEEIINQVEPVTEEPTPAPTPTPTPTPTPEPTPEPGPDVDIEDNDQPNTDGDNEEDINDNDQPKSDGKGPNYAMIAGVGGSAILLGAMIFYFLKKKNEEQAASEE